MRRYALPILLMAASCAAPGPPEPEIVVDKATVYLYRPDYWFGYMYSPAVSVDGEERFDLPHNSHRRFLLTAGSHEIAVAAYTCFPTTVTRFSFEPGRVYYVRFWVPKVPPGPAIVTPPPVPLLGAFATTIIGQQQANEACTRTPILSPVADEVGQAELRRTRRAED